MTVVLLSINAVLLVVVAVSLHELRKAKRPRVSRGYEDSSLERIARGIELLARVVQEPGETGLAANTDRQIRRTCIDIQGAIALFARWAVMNVPEEAVSDMDVPEHWLVRRDGGLAVKGDKK